MNNRDKLYVSLECSINKSNQNICILCDSIIKEIKPYKMRQSLKAKNKKYSSNHSQEPPSLHA